MKNKEIVQFYELLKKFLLEYLPIRRNFSEKTIRAYKQSLNAYRKYLATVKGISFDKMDFTHFSRDNVYAFLTWLKQERGCTAQTQNLRLSAIKSFLRFCSEENVELMSLFIKISEIHEFKKQQPQVVKYLTTEQLKLLFSIPDINTQKGRRDRFL